ncbi:MAG: hypothetical protein HY518_02645 [Candidatus Aenigmarchaeota archaeon]|nr:hypothetical protein [Candidatus Aenigmarchaeota archaeon]
MTQGGPFRYLTRFLMTQSLKGYEGKVYRGQTRSGYELLAVTNDGYVEAAVGCDKEGRLIFRAGKNKPLVEALEAIRSK